MRQKQALAVMMSGANVFLTGAPGAGKTYVLNEFVGRAMRAGKKLAVTASTGIAASHIGGTTIHSWSGLGILEELTSDELRRLGGVERLTKRYNGVDILVIDEVSMLHGRRLDMVNRLAKRLRANEAPFGGLQVILVGDLFQLPPVNRGLEASDFVHLSAAWAELNPAICYLTEQHRQSSSDRLLELLEAMRRGEFDTQHHEWLQARVGRLPEPSLVVTKLYAHNLDVDSINQQHLAALPASSKRFEMYAKGSRTKVEQLAKGLLAPPVLNLKVGAEVMFVSNNFAEGFVNGSRGQVVAFEDELPVVRLNNGRDLLVEAHTWSLTEDGRVRAEISQLPLRLAWAITIHKSQGMSLDAAQIDLSRAFTPGMGYVALSRVRGLDGLYLQGLNQMALRLHPGIYELDEHLRQASQQLSQITVDITNEEPTIEVEAPIDEALLNKLKTWRFARAQADKLPAFMIAHNTALSAVAAAKPTTTQQLLGVSGFGPKKVETYGPDIIAIVIEHMSI